MEAVSARRDAVTWCVRSQLRVTEGETMVTVLAVIGGITVLAVGGGVALNRAVKRGWNPFR